MKESLLTAALCLMACVSGATAAPYTVTGLGFLPGGSYSAANGLNDAGQVVGHSSSSGGGRAFLWDAASGLQDLGTLPGGTFSAAHDINEAGQIVGQSEATEGLRAFLWEAETGMRDLGVLPGGSASAAAGVNDAGHVVGNSTIADEEDACSISM